MTQVISITEARALLSKAKPSKYRNKRCEMDGFKFPSQREMNRYAELKLRQRAGEIDKLTLQKKFPLFGASGMQIASYIADFYYFDVSAKHWIVEDAKGCRTAFYKLKKKWFEADWRMPIIEI